MIDYYERVGMAIGFIERHLTDPIQVADLAKAAFSSQWHLSACYSGDRIRERTVEVRCSQAELERAVQAMLYTVFASEFAVVSPFPIDCRSGGPFTS